MIECVFTLDYEIYGNGLGSLKELVDEPAERLWAIFRKAKARFVAFVEVAELEMIEAKGTDPALDLVKDQVRAFQGEGFELGLHVHPWWYKASYENGGWRLDYGEYNLCTLSPPRIAEIVDRSIAYLRDLVGVSGFTPLAYRAGHLLFQPTQPTAGILAARGIKVDSSVYKGGRWRQHGLDYRPALRNGYYWRFTNHSDVPDPSGHLLEIPIHSRMVAGWKLLTGKRIGLQRKGASAAQASKKMLSRVLDLCRPHALKLDFCHMTLDELTRTVDAVLDEDRRDPAQFRPIVAIGHTKDLVDVATVEAFLAYLRRKGIAVSTFEDAYQRCTS